MFWLVSILKLENYCLSCFSVAVKKHHDLTWLIEEFILSYICSCIRIHHSMEQPCSRIGSRSRKMRKHISTSSRNMREHTSTSSRKMREQTGTWVRLIISKSAPSNIHPPASLHYWKHHKQHCQLGTKCSNTQTYQRCFLLKPS